MPFHVRCQRPDLLVALQAADAVVPANSAKPILTNLLLDADRDELRIVATDLQVGLRAVVRRFRCEEAGQLVVPARKLVNILKESASTDVSCELVEEEDRHLVLIELDDGTYRVPAVIGEAFPEVSAYPADAPAAVLPAGDLERMIRKTLFAVDRERSSAVLSGLLLHAAAGRVEMTATDGKVLGEAVGEDFELRGTEELAAILPAATVNHLSRIIGLAVGQVELAIAGNLLFARCAIGEEDGDGLIQIELTGRCIDGSYPPYQSALEPKDGATVRFRTAEVASAVRRAALLTNTGSRGIVLDIDREQALISNLNHSAGTADIPVGCSYDGEPTRVGMNAGYFGEVLRAFDSDEIAIEIAGSGRGLVMRDGDATYLIMPITLPS